MNLSWTFFPEPGLSVTLTVVYVPDLDAEALPFGGYLDREQNLAYVNWDTYKRFDSSDVKSRRDAFQQLVTLSQGGSIRRKDGTPIALPVGV